MNLSRLGDALDHLKGSLMDLLHGVIQDVHVLPMLTDAELWTARHVDAYARLLRTRPGRICLAGMTCTAANRGAYFAAARRELSGVDCDLFLDPDTGVSPQVTDDPGHLPTGLLADLLDDAPGRLVMIFQAARHEANYTERAVEQIRRTPSLVECHALAYAAGGASLLFVARNAQRIRSVAQRLHDILGPMATASAARLIQ